MKNTFFLIAFLFSLLGSSQSTIGVNSSITTSLRIDENSIIYDKLTGERINIKDLSALFSSYPQSVVITKEEDVNGNPISFYFIKDMNTESMSVPSSKRVKIFRKDISNSTFDLNNVESKYSVIILQLSLELPMINIEAIREAEHAALKRGYTSVILTSSTLKQSKIFAQEHDLKSVIIPNAHNLMGKFKYKKYPMFVILNNDKSILKSLKYYYEVEEELSKLK